MTDTEHTERTEHAEIDDQLCFALYAASRAVMSEYRTRLTPLGLTYPQYLTLLAVWQNDGSTVSELSAALDLDSGTLSPILKRLSTMNLITKSRSGSDERSVTVTSTESGWRLEPEVADVRDAVETCTGLTASEFDQLRAALHTLRHTIRRPPSA